MSFKIALGGDHGGFKAKKFVKEMLIKHEHTLHDFGTDNEDSVDYPDFVHPLAVAVGNEEYDFGILFCGSANGVCMSANKHQNIRAAIAWQPEIAALAKQHNNANVLCIPGRFLNEDELEEIINSFINATFEGGRHQRRVDKIPC